MSNKKTFLNILQVAVSNCTTIVSGIIIGFLLPKILKMEDFGLYKTFTLYTNYIGFFSLGIIDGIVLEYGGYDYNNLNRKKFRSFFRWYVIVHLVFTIFLIISGFCAENREYGFITMMLGIDLMAVNITGYYQQISQFTRRFREFSIRKIIQSLSNIVIVVAMLLLYLKGFSVAYKGYIVASVAVNLMLTGWYVFTYRTLSFGTALSLMETKSELIHLIKIGFPLLFANLCSTLILNLDRQFVNILFDNASYAVYAFAYNMLSLVTVVTSAVSTVLYPMLKRADRDNMMKSYPKLSALMLCFVFSALVTYFPLQLFVKWFLPQYADSIIIFRVIFPGLAITSTITVIMHNYYKVLGANLLYFKKSVVVLFFSAVANYIAYMLFKTTISISVASIITMILWYIYIDAYLAKEISKNMIRNRLYILLMCAVFYSVTTIENILIGIILYTVCTIMITLLFYKNLIGLQWK